MILALSAADTIELSTEEIALLRFTCDLVLDRDSPFAAVRDALVDRHAPEAQRRSARSLVEKGLADPRTYRPQRELLRRLLVVSEPDARIILLAAAPGCGERLIDVYGRAGAYVQYVRSGQHHRLGPPLELVDVFDDVHSHFSPRRSNGDLIDLRLTALEYVAFSAAASELARRRSEGSTNVRLDSARPKSFGDATLGGAIVMPGRKNRFAPGPDAVRMLPVPCEDEWRVALHGLSDKGAICKIGETYQLRDSLEELALGLALGTRHILTRIDFREQDWVVRDATLIHVPGSLFWLHPTDDGGLLIREVDPDMAKRAIRGTIEDVD